RFLQLQSTESGSTLSIGENGGQLASTLGLRTMDVNTPVGQLNFGQGIFAKDQANDLIIKRTNGSEMLVNLDGVQTVGDVLSRINNHVDNFTASLRVTATLATSGNGLVLTAPSGVEPIQIKNAGGSQAAWGLGLVAQGSERASGVSSGSNSVIRGADVSGVEVEGVFTSLLRMREAVHSGSTEDLERITAALDVDEQRMSMARSLVGTRQQAIERMKDLSAEQQVQLKGIESQELDADLAQVISELTARQTALEASLQLMGQSSRRSLFDYL
ncbi:MAG: hypothetical protein KDA45_08170, partial [Planctomycetales bacterium]|nr:hypothetical protein [Planctomycetales bacterium]